MSKPFAPIQMIAFVERVKKDFESKSTDNTPLEEKLLTEVERYLKEIF
jgi:hypothetical protein